FTAGLGAYFWLSRGPTKGQLLRFLLSRGGWVMFLGATLGRLAVGVSFTSSPFVVYSVWGVGVGVIAVALLVFLSVPSFGGCLTGFSRAVIALHNLLNPVPMWPGLHQLAPFQVGETTVVIAYTLIPWFAVMAAGFCFGRIMELPEASRWAWMIRIGAAATAVF